MVFNALVLMSAICFSFITSDILRLVWTRHRIPRNAAAVAEWSVFVVFVSIDFTTIYLLWNIIFHGYEPTNMGISYPIWIIRSLAAVFCWLAVRNARTNTFDIVRSWIRGEK
jgi:hypothetical protein